MKIERSVIHRLIIIVTSHSELEAAAAYCKENNFRLVSATAISRKHFEVIAEKVISTERGNDDT